MLRMINQYCSNCLSTQRFLDLGATLTCERCNKRLERPDTVSQDGAENRGARAPAERFVTWADHPSERREAS